MKMFKCEVYGNEFERVLRTDNGLFGCVRGL